jgi:hypothetical protein
VLTIPAGLDETRLAVVDDTSVIAESTWPPAENYQPGPATWDWRLHRLGYDRTGPWQPDEFGFACNVQPRGGAPNHDHDHDRASTVA